MGSFWVLINLLGITNLCPTQHCRIDALMVAAEHYDWTPRSNRTNGQ